MNGDNVKTAVGVPEGFFMHVYQTMLCVVGNDPRNELLKPVGTFATP
jgi:hypothetical protein